MRKLREIDFLSKQLANWFVCAALVETSCGNLKRHA